MLFSLKVPNDYYEIRNEITYFIFPDKLTIKCEDIRAASNGNIVYPTFEFNKRIGSVCMYYSEDYKDLHLAITSMWEENESYVAALTTRYSRYMYVHNLKTQRRERRKINIIELQENWYDPISKRHTSGMIKWMACCWGDCREIDENDKRDDVGLQYITHVGSYI